MNVAEYFIYLIVMAGSTYLIRAIPFALVKEKTKNIYIKSFLAYIPYAVLTAMTIPAVFYTTASVISASLGVIIAIIISLKKESLLLVAIAACVMVYIAEIFI